MDPAAAAAPTTPREAIVQQQQLQEDEESPLAQDPSWLDEPLFAEDGDVPPADASFWEKVWSTPQRLKPVARRRMTPHENPAATCWNKVIGTLKYVILLLVVFGLWPMGLLSFRVFTKNTDSTFHPIPNSVSERAQQAFARAFPDDWSDPMSPALFVVLRSNHSLKDQDSPAYDAFYNFTYDLADQLNKTCWSPKDHCQYDPQLRTTSYFTFQQAQLSWVANTMVTPDGKTSLIRVEYMFAPDVPSMVARHRITDVMDAIETFGTERTVPGLFNVSYTGIKWFQSDLMEATQTDLKRMDMVAVPLVLIMLGFVLPRARSWYVWIVPLITMISTVCCWSLLMRYVVQHMQITQFTPSIMMSLTLGMGIDYTLFLLARYLEDDSSSSSSIINDDDNDDERNDKSKAIRTMIQQGGNVVLLSGLTLMCTFLGLCFMPLQMLKSIGVGAAIAISTSLLVNLTVVPAMLHTPLGDWIIRKETDHAHEELPQDEFDPLANIGENPLDDDADGNDRAVVPVTSIWYRLGKNLLHRYKSVIIFLAVSQFVVPIALNVARIKTSIAFELLLPSTSPALRVSDLLNDELGPGSLAPYKILFDGKDANITMDSEEGFNVMHRVLDEFIGMDVLGSEQNGSTHVETDDAEVKELTDELMEELGLNAGWKSNKTLEKEKKERENATLCNKDVKIDEERLYEEERKHKTQYEGIAVLKNVRIPYSLYHSAMLCTRIKPHCPVEALHLIAYIDSIATSEDRYASVSTATLGVDPFTDEGIQWLRSARETLRRLEEHDALSGVHVHIQGSASIAHDAVDAVMKAFPTMISITLVVVFLLMGAFFRSFVTPLRSVVSISFTLAFVFGLAILVFQDGIFGWTGVPIFKAATGEVCWLVPVMAFSIMVGLALDYDVFLVSRILEFRTEQGYGHKSSIVAGLHATGGIITAAGLIMAVAFGGLMLSSSPVLYQWSFLISTAVLLDTFVIRTLIVPIVMGWTGSWSWWPRRLPMVRVVLPGFEDKDDEDVDDHIPETEPVSDESNGPTYMS